MLEILSIILVGGGIIAAICFAFQIYNWYLDSKHAEPIIQEKRLELNEANKKIKELEKLRLEIAKLQSQIDGKDKNIEKLIDEKEYWRNKYSEACRDYREKCEIINSGNYEASKKLAENMATQHKLIEYYNSDDINAFRNYFDSVAFERYLNSIFSYRFVKSFDEKIKIVSKVEVGAQVASASEDGKTYSVTLNSCECIDFIRINKNNKSERKTPCKHMLFLAMQLGVLPYKRDSYDEECEKVVAKLRELRQQENKNKDLKKSIELEETLKKEIDQQLPHFTELLAKYKNELDVQRVNLISPQAKKSREIASDIIKEKKALEIERDLALNQLALYEYWCPELKEYKKLPLTDKVVKEALAFHNLTKGESRGRN